MIELLNDPTLDHNRVGSYRVRLLQATEGESAEAYPAHERVDRAQDEQCVEHNHDESSRRNELSRLHFLMVEQRVVVCSLKRAE